MFLLVATAIFVTWLAGCDDRRVAEESFAEMDRVFNEGRPEADRLAGCMLAALRPEAAREMGMIDAENPSPLNDMRPHNPMRDQVTEALARHCGADMSVWATKHPGIDPRGLTKNMYTELGVLSVAYGTAHESLLKAIAESDAYKEGQAAHERKLEAALLLKEARLRGQELERQQRLKEFAVKEGVPPNP